MQHLGHQVAQQHRQQQQQVCSWWVQQRLSLHLQGHVCSQ
jgi:hypothetical protein